MTVSIEPAGWIRLRDNFEIYAKTWTPPKETPLLATVTFVHGLGEHIGRYEKVFSAFQKAGIQVHAWDQRGFGQTGKRHGKLGDYGNRELILEDVKEAIVRNTVQGKPRFLAGHSMGGLIVLDFVCSQVFHLDGVISTAPALGIPSASQPFWIVKTLGKCASYLLPSMVVKNGLNLKGLALDPLVAEDYAQDPLNHPWISLQLADLLLSHGKLVMKAAKAMPRDLPILLTHGDGDPITDPKSTFAFYQAIENKDKSMQMYQGYLHELHNESDIHAQYIQTLIHWVLERSAKS